MFNYLFLIIEINHFRPRSPACDTSQAESLSRMQSKGCLSNDFVSLSARKHRRAMAEQQSNLINNLHLKKVYSFAIPLRFLRSFLFFLIFARFQSSIKQMQMDGKVMLFGFFFEFKVVTMCIEPVKTGLELNCSTNENFLHV